VWSSVFLPYFLVSRSSLSYASTVVRATATGTLTHLTDALMLALSGNYKLPLHLSCAASILGHVLYACAYPARQLYLILAGRIVSGIAFSMFMYHKRYCADPRIVGIRRRTTLASLLVLTQGMGMTLGPLFGGLLYKVGFPNPWFNGLTRCGGRRRLMLLR